MFYICNNAFTVANRSFIASGVNDGSDTALKFV